MSGKKGVMKRVGKKAGATKDTGLGMSGSEFLENRLVKLVGKAGKVAQVYGGFQITVLHADKFDFAAVFDELLAYGQLVSVEEKEGALVITANY